MNRSSVILKTSAPAKINLALKLVGKRSDGYHLLDSIFVPCPALFDDIEITLNDGNMSVKMSSNLKEMTDAETNLCSKAAFEYFKMTDIKTDCHIHLEKRIPIGAGLGGGSSDCAAVLKLLNSHYQKLSGKQLYDIALSLGADVPFFLVNRVSHVTGIGENIEPLDCLTELPLAVFSPPFSISTPWAFKNINPSIIGFDPLNSSSKIIEALQNDDILTAAEMLHNDFESLVFCKFPAYEVWRRYLVEHGALHVGLSGSGSSFFALFETAEKLEKAVESFHREYGILFNTKDES